LFDWFTQTLIVASEFPMDGMEYHDNKPPFCKV
jgi:hypothetical protein